MILGLFVLIGGVLIFASLIDFRQKKRYKQADMDMDIHTKVGDDMNYLMGENHYSDGGSID